MCLICYGVTAGATGLGGLVAPPVADLPAVPMAPPATVRSIDELSLAPVQLQRPTQTPKIAGTTCPKPGLKRDAAEARFVCKKKGKKLVWVERKRSGSTPAATPNSPKEIYKPPTTDSAPISDCQLIEVSEERRRWDTQAAGFPTLQKYIPHQGTVRMSLVPIDWEDVPGNDAMLAEARIQTQKVSDWYESVSDGRLKIEWVFHPTWVRMPGNSSSYSVNFSGDKPATANFYGRVIPVVDEVFDFTGVQVANFLLPRGQTFVREGVQDWPWEEFTARHTKEGSLIAAATPGAYFDRWGHEYWTYWAHEFGHTLQLAHVGSSFVRSSMHSWDLMGDQNGHTRELSGWMRFVAGWLNDSQIYCQDLAKLEPTTLTFRPLNVREPGVKAAVVRLSETEAIVIESRRPTRFACTDRIVDANFRNVGVLVYMVDVTKGGQQEFLTTVRPEGRQPARSGCPTETEPNPLLQSGESVAIKGLNVSVSSSNSSNEFDTVTISRS